MQARFALVASAVASLLYLLTPAYAAADWRVFLKVASVALLAVLGFRVSKLLGAALSFGALGDFLLDVPSLGSFGPAQLFLFGLGAFLTGHIVYIVMFRSFARVSWTALGAPRRVATATVVVTLICVLGILRGSLGPLLVPVIVYALVLATMAITAQLAELGNSLAAVGALSFVASDAMLAMDKFHAPFPASSALIWITYYCAQLLICLGVSRGRFQSFFYTNRPKP
jgi:uncharacterized membrane protein YhhN